MKSLRHKRAALPLSVPEGNALVTLYDDWHEGRGPRTVHCYKCGWIGSLVLRPDGRFECEDGLCRSHSSDR
jgi:hypothetical protein